MHKQASTKTCFDYATMNKFGAMGAFWAMCAFSIDGYFNCATKNEFVATVTFSIDGYAETGCCVLPWNTTRVGHESDMRSGKMVNFQCNCGASILIHGAKNLLYLGIDWANPKFLSGGEAFGAYSCSTVGNPNPTTPECGDLASAPSTLASSTFTAKGSTGEVNCFTASNSEENNGRGSGINPLFAATSTASKTSMGATPEANIITQRLTEPSTVKEASAQ
jgi:hypothetical protein